MKKLISYGLTILLGAGLLVSCGDNEVKQEDPKPTEPQSDKIAGEWHVTFVQNTDIDASGNIIGNPVSRNYKRGEYSWSFTPPSTYSYKDQRSITEGRYQLKNDSLITTIPNTSYNSTIRYKIDSLTTTRLVLSTILEESFFPGGKFISIYKFSR